MYIYKIIQINTGKIYVGSTNNFKRRWREHKWKLRIIQHDNPHLQNLYNKYGPESFRFTVEEDLTGRSYADVIKREQSLIESLDPQLRINLATPMLSDVIPHCGHTPESKRAIAASKLGIPRTEAVRKACREGKRGIFKAVIGRSLTTDQIVEFESTKDAEKAGFGRKEIRGCCNHSSRNTSHKGYAWSWKEAS